MTTAREELFAALRLQLGSELDSLLSLGRSLESDRSTLAAEGAEGELRRRGGMEGDTVAVEREVLGRLSQGQQTSLAEVQAALRRLEAGTFGACTGCGQDIPDARLEARPKASTCVSCAGKPA